MYQTLRYSSGFFLPARKSPQLEPESSPLSCSLHTLVTIHWTTTFLQSTSRFIVVALRRDRFPHGDVYSRENGTRSQLSRDLAAIA